MDRVTEITPTVDLEPSPLVEVLQIALGIAQQSVVDAMEATRESVDRAEKKMRRERAGQLTGVLEALIELVLAVRAIELSAPNPSPSTPPVIAVERAAA